MSRSMYYDDFEPGQVFTSQARTMTETDLTMFSMLTGDWNPIHNDSEFAGQSRFGQRLMHGAFGIGLGLGLMHTLGIFEDSAVALLDIEGWKFVEPVLIGDTLHLRLEIIDKSLGKSGNTGRIGRKFELVNQHGRAAHVGRADVLVRVRPVS
ncbi:Acyl dehydratase [Roseivivax halotolerans]|uniref:Acyl dehydratase n=2 Tax=Roseivivax TaxID=93682 RepID=A0A1I6AJF5_9RHOB|nr:MaoC/PaaZ C-terminal domain-containing protein [Roseivivax halotolerans]QFT62699.1 Bifunctional protein PaaZ [Roseivivax sp. THAF30]SFQ68773.1 Acyl dehydratase [Roseivivax halotolerans]